jgi:hypothetical protein
MPTAIDGDLVRALTGAWQLVGWTIEYPPSGRVTQPFGADPEGLLVYTADGYMSAVMQRRSRPPLSRADPHAVSDAEKAAAFATYLHYSGAWSVSNGNVIHDVRHAMNPNLIGTRQVRSVTLDGNRLELGATEQLETPGASRRHRILWRRAPQP